MFIVVVIQKLVVFLCLLLIVLGLIQAFIIRENQRKIFLLSAWAAFSTAILIFVSPLPALPEFFEVIQAAFFVYFGFCMLKWRQKIRNEDQ